MRGVLGACLVFACLSAPAQDHYGAGTPGSGGFVPELTSNQAWMGNAGFALHVTHGLGGATAIVAISLQPASFFCGGTQVLVSLAPADVWQMSSVMLSGMQGSPGAGAATIAIPLTFPVNPALAGMTAYAQAGVLDYTAPGTFAASRGLRVTLTMPPLAAVTSTTFAGTTKTRLIDPLTMTEPYALPVISSDPSSGAAFAHGGRDLFIARSNGNRIDRVDFSGAAPVGSVFHYSFGSCRGVAVDRTHDLVYTLVQTTAPASGQSLVAIDANAAHATFGQQIASGAAMPYSGYYVVWGLSPTGNRLAIVPGNCQSMALLIVDTDPASPTYLQTLSTSQLPSQWCWGGSTDAGPHPGNVVFAHDDQRIFVLTYSGVPFDYCGTGAGGIYRYDLPAGSWIDFNPQLVFSQPISGSSQPAVYFDLTTRDLVTTSDGLVNFVTGVGLHARIVHDPNVPGIFTVFNPNPSGPACQGEGRCALTVDESLLITASSYQGSLSVARITPGTLAIQALYTPANAGDTLETLAVR